MESKTIAKTIFMMLLIATIVVLVLRGISDYVIPYLMAMQTIELQEKYGLATICIMLTMVLILITCFILCGTVVCRKLHGLFYRESFESDSITDTQVAVVDGFKELKDRISQEEQSIMRDYYNQKLGPRMKGRLSACITECMCDLEYVSRSEPGYEKIENFLKKDLQLDAPNYQQIAESHDKLKDALKSYRDYSNGNGVEPDKKDLTRAEEYYAYVKHYKDKMRAFEVK